MTSHTINSNQPGRRLVVSPQDDAVILTQPGGQQLVDKHDMTDLTYSSVRDYVAKRRPEIWAAAGKAVEVAFVPQTHEPGAEGEVDFADLWIDLAGQRTKVFLFTMRLSFSGKAVHRAPSQAATQGQEAFLEGHQAAFEIFGGTPMFHIRYHNLKAAVSRVWIRNGLSRQEIPYVTDATGTMPMQARTMAPGQLWIMGDDRDNAVDSRLRGPAELKDVVTVGMELEGIDGRNRPIPGAQAHPAPGGPGDIQPEPRLLQLTHPRRDSAQMAEA